MFRNPNLDMSVHGSPIHTQTGNYPHAYAQEEGQIMHLCKRILPHGKRSRPFAQPRELTGIMLRKEGHQSTHYGVLPTENSRRIKIRGAAAHVCGGLTGKWLENC